MRFKKTEVCQTCSKMKNVCQTCLLDLEYGNAELLWFRISASNILICGYTVDIYISFSKVMLTLKE